MKIRINDLARELEVKSKQILDVLIKVGVTEKKTHSSSVEVNEAEKVRKYFHETSGSHPRHRGGSEEFRPKIDLSKISKPGDALKAILARRDHPVDAPVAAPVPPPVAPKAIVNKPTAAPKAPAPTAPVVAERAPRFVTPESVAQRTSAQTAVEPPRPAAAVAPSAPPVAAAEAPVAVAERPTPPVERPEAVAEPVADATPVSVEAGPAAEAPAVAVAAPVESTPAESAPAIETPVTELRPLPRQPRLLPPSLLRLPRPSPFPTSRRKAVLRVRLPVRPRFLRPAA